MSKRKAIILFGFAVVAATIYLRADHINERDRIRREKWEAGQPRRDSIANLIHVRDSANVAQQNAEFEALTHEQQDSVVDAYERQKDSIRDAESWKNRKRFWPKTK